MEIDAGVIYNVVDGDTFDALVCIGYKTFRDVRIRALYIDAPELSTPEGQEAKIFARDTLLNTKVEIIATGRTDSFGRYLADIRGEFGLYSKYAIENKQAKPYED